MWARIVNFFLGLWLMAAPAALGYAGPAAVNDRLVGPLVASFALVAIWQTTNALRWTNLALGLWLMLSPFVIGAWSGEPYTFEATLSSSLAGLYIAALAF